MSVPERGFRHKTLSESSGSAASEMLHHDPPAAAMAAAATSTTTATAAPGEGGSGRRALACESVYLLPTRLATVGVALLQGAMLDVYLTRYSGARWFAWVAGDVAVVMMFAVAFVISYRQMAQAMRRLLDGSAPPRGQGEAGGLADGWGEKGGEGVWSPGSMPLAYFAWLVYSGVLAIRVLLIYNNLAHTLPEDTFLGVNTLQMTVAVSSLVFVLLVLAHHDAAPGSRRRQRIDVLTLLVPVDLVDAADMLAVLTVPGARAAMAGWAVWAVMGVACLNLVLPTLPLMALSSTHFGTRPLSQLMQTVHRLLVLFAVNLPLLVTRLLLWQQLQLSVSTLLVKNAVVSFHVLYSFYDRDHHDRLRQRLTGGQEMAS